MGICVAGATFAPAIWRAGVMPGTGAPRVALGLVAAGSLVGLVVAASYQSIIEVDLALWTQVLVWILVAMTPWFAGQRGVELRALRQRGNRSTKYDQLMVQRSDETGVDSSLWIHGHLGSISHRRKRVLSCPKCGQRLPSDVKSGSHMCKGCGAGIAVSFQGV